ncbi:MAG TPA: nuclease [Desulfonatronum sp.]|nr:nuclease [Desulfonatronum sp.]
MFFRAQSLLVCVVCMLWAALLHAQEARVRWVPDGDTLHLADERKVRLMGIDAPEMATDRDPEQYYARESREFLQRLVEGQEVRLETDTREQDRYGRILAYVYLPDGRMVNEVLVEQGFAFFYHHAHQDRILQKKLLEAQNRAIFARKGFWPRLLSLPQPPTGWVGNRRSKRFHDPESFHAQQVSQKNRVLFFSLEQAFREGYAPARNSFDWPEAVSR